MSFLIFHFLSQRPNRFLSIGIFVLFFVAEVSAQQITDGNHYFYECGGAKTDYKLYTTNNASVLWSVQGGVFTEYPNATQVSLTPTGPDGSNNYYSHISVTWGQWNSAVQATISAAGFPDKNVNLAHIDIPITASPSPVPSGSEVTLTANPQSGYTDPAYTYLWTTSSSNANIKAPTTNASVKANPIIPLGGTPTTATFSAKVTYTVTLTINDVVARRFTCDNSQSITVPLSASVVTGNSICCSQCLVLGATPASIGQSSGVSLGGASQYNYQWLTSANGTTFTPVSGTAATFNPPTQSQPAWYKRVVNLGSYSNTIKVESFPTDLTWPYYFFSVDTDVKAFNDIVITQDQFISTGYTANIIAGNSIVVRPTVSARITPGINLKIGSPCTPPGGRMRETDDFVKGETLTLPDTPVVEPIAISVPPSSRPALNYYIYTDDYDQYLSVYPNPAKDVVKVQYRVSTQGPVKLFIADEEGSVVTTLVDRTDVGEGTYQVGVNVERMKAGIYFYTLIAGGKKQTQKVIVE